MAATTTTESAMPRLIPYEGMYDFSVINTNQGWLNACERVRAWESRIDALSGTISGFGGVYDAMEHFKKCIREGSFCSMCGADSKEYHDETCITTVRCDECCGIGRARGSRVDDIKHDKTCSKVQRCKECDGIVDVQYGNTLCYAHKETCSEFGKCDDCGNTHHHGDRWVVHPMGCSNKATCNNPYCQAVLNGNAKCPKCGLHTCEHCDREVRYKSDHAPDCTVFYCKDCEKHVVHVHTERACPLAHCSECGSFTSHSSSTRYHKMTCSVVPKCEGCGVRTDYRGTTHRIGCTLVKVPTCDECGTRTDFKGARHRSGCTKQTF